MENVRDGLRANLVNLTLKIYSVLLKHLTDEFASEFEHVFYGHFFESFHCKVGDNLQENLKSDIKYNYSEPW